MIKKFFKVLWDYIKFLFFILYLIILFLIGLGFITIIWKGKIYIEVLITFILFYIFLFWKIWLKHSRKKLLKKYKPENDKTRKGELDKGTGREKSTAGIATASLTGLDKLERREHLQETNVDSIRKNRKGIRKFLGRRRR